MKRIHIILVSVAVAVTTTSAVYAGSDRTAPAKAVAKASARGTQARYSIDASGLKRRPTSLLPAKRLRAAAFSQASIARALGPGARSAKPETRIGESRVRTEAQDWIIERDPKLGAIMTLRQPGSQALKQAPRRTVGESKVVSLAHAQLTRFGIPDDERGQTAVRELMAQDRSSDGGMTTARLHAYKTFVPREVNGVRVQGHRAVITHSPGGTMKRALIHWPAVSKSGHRLSTRLSTREITARAQARLAREQVPEGSSVRLHWKYVPEPQRDGSVTLKLVAAARVTPATRSKGGGGEPLEFDIPVDAR